MPTGAAGSLACMAPRILVKRSYSYTIDWWPLGVCAYELTFCRRPFRGRTNGDPTHRTTNDSSRLPENTEHRKRGMQVPVSSRGTSRTDWNASSTGKKFGNSSHPSDLFVVLHSTVSVCLLFSSPFRFRFIRALVRDQFSTIYSHSSRGKTLILRLSWKNCFQSQSTRSTQGRGCRRHVACDEGDRGIVCTTITACQGSPGAKTSHRFTVSDVGPTTPLTRLSENSPFPDSYGMEKRLSPQDGTDESYVTSRNSALWTCWCTPFAILLLLFGQSGVVRSPLC